MTIDTYLMIASTIVSIAAVIAAALPKPNDKANRAIKAARLIIDILACNFGHAKNQQQQPQQPTDKQS